MLSFTIKIPTLKDIYYLFDKKARLRTAANYERVKRCHDDILFIIDTAAISDSSKEMLKARIDEAFDKVRLYNVGYWSDKPKRKTNQYN